MSGSDMDATVNEYAVVYGVDIDNDFTLVE